MLGESKEGVSAALNMDSRIEIGSWCNISLELHAMSVVPKIECCHWWMMANLLSN